MEKDNVDSKFKKRWISAVSRSLLNDFGHSSIVIQSLLEKFRVELHAMHEEGTASAIAARLMHAQVVVNDKNRD